jgi:NAD(P)-dependent dehydrogenase (short-subunit alcohol dehydrogenase family)
MTAALVTGAGKRIGRQIALDLAGQGFDVAINYNGSAEDAEDVAKAIRAKGRKAQALKADLSDADQTAALLTKASQALGPVTCLVNNASIFDYDDIKSMTVKSWDAHLDINLRAPALLSQAFARQLPHGAIGNIVNIIDQRVWKLTPQFFSYTASKAGLWAITQTLAQALAPRIRVNAIGPGPALASSRMEEAEFQKQASRTILGRGTSPEEIAAAVIFILSQPAMTGQMLALDGGQHLSWKTPDVTEIQE